jgi:hypothetical protein
MIGPHALTYSAVCLSLVAAIAAGCAQSARNLAPEATPDPTPEQLTRAALRNRPPEQVMALRTLPVLRCLSGTGGGSAVPIAPNVVLLSRHQLKDDTYSGMEIGGRMRTIRVMTAGAVEGWPGDWAYVSLEPPVRRCLEVVEPDRELPTGTRLFLVGYWHGHDRITRDQGRAVPKSIVEAVVVDPPRHPEAPDRDRAVCCRTSYTGPLGGMSGGAAVVWDHSRAALVLVGIYQGVWQIRANGRRVVEAVHVVRRIPDPFSRTPRAT